MFPDFQPHRCCSRSMHLLHRTASGRYRRAAVILPRAGCGLQHLSGGSVALPPQGLGLVGWGTQLCFTALLFYKCCPPVFRCCPNMSQVGTTPFALSRHDPVRVLRVQA